MYNVMLQHIFDYISLACRLVFAKFCVGSRVRKTVNLFRISDAFARGFVRCDEEKKKKKTAPRSRVSGKNFRIALLGVFGQFATAAAAT